MTATIAVVGLGRLGATVARRLVEAGHRVSGFDVSADAAGHARGLGVQVAGSCPEALRGAETVITVLPDAAVVEAAAPEILAAAEPGSCWLEMSSSHPETTRALAARAAEHGIALLDIPVAGGVAGAEKGVLTVMAAGPAALVERTRPVLEVFGQRIIHISERPGDGNVAKTINNLLAAANLAAASEGLALGLAAGLDVDILLDVLNASSATSFATTTQIPTFARAGEYSARFTIGQYAKDARVALDVAHRHGMEPAMLTRAHDLWNALADDGHAGEDYTRITPLTAEASGVEWPERG
ncbi:3-hydroxyisobutyrate dehydrogenase OS=Streptomyces fumanus OX=67302 GN=mmsB PE=3 SV=1 [Streptomyces fumanus]